MHDDVCERLDPITAQDDLYAEHIVRYQFALGFASRKRVLDCATGVGYGAALMASVADMVVGVDNASEAIREASNRYARRNIRFLQADGRSLPLRNNSVDLVVSLETIEHAPDPERFIAEFRRVLAPAGILILSTPNTDVYRHEDGVENPFHEHEFTVKELSALLRRHFPSVTMLAERHQTSVVIGPPDRAPMGIWFGDEQAPRADVLERSPYLVAVCSSKAVKTTGLVRFFTGGSRLQELVAWTHSTERELERLRNLVADLQEMVEERTTWARDLDVELARARAVVSKLQDEFAERTAWAKDLDTELSETRLQVTQFAGEVTKRTNWAHNLETELGQARELIKALQDELENRTAWAGGLDALLSGELERQRGRNDSTSTESNGHSAHEG